MLGKPSSRPDKVSGISLGPSLGVDAAVPPPPPLLERRPDVRAIDALRRYFPALIFIRDPAAVGGRLSGGGRGERRAWGGHVGK